MLDIKEIDNKIKICIGQFIDRPFITSFPVFTRIDSHLCISKFICLFENYDIKSNVITYPIGWISYDLCKKQIINIFLEDDEDNPFFSKYNDNIKIPLFDMNKGLDAYHIFYNICTNLDNEKLNMHEYNNYLDLLNQSYTEFADCYNKLSMRIPDIDYILDTHTWLPVNINDDETIYQDYLSNIEECYLLLKKDDITITNNSILVSTPYYDDGYVYLFQTYELAKNYIDNILNGDGYISKITSIKILSGLNIKFGYDINENNFLFSRIATYPRKTNPQYQIYNCTICHEDIDSLFDVCKNMDFCKNVEDIINNEIIYIIFNKQNDLPYIEDHSIFIFTDYTLAYLMLKNLSRNGFALKIETMKNENLIVTNFLTGCFSSLDIQHIVINRFVENIIRNIENFIPYNIKDYIIKIKEDSPSIDISYNILNYIQILFNHKVEENDKIEIRKALIQDIKNSIFILPVLKDNYGNILDVDTYQTVNDIGVLVYTDLISFNLKYNETKYTTLYLPGDKLLFNEEFNKIIINAETNCFIIDKFEYIDENIPITQDPTQEVKNMPNEECHIIPEKSNDKNEYSEEKEDLHDLEILIVNKNIMPLEKAKHYIREIESEPDILKECYYTIKNDKYPDNQEALCFNNYTAKRIKEQASNKNLDMLTVYNFLVFMKNSPKDAQNILDNKLI